MKRPAPSTAAARRRPAASRRRCVEGRNKETEHHLGGQEIEEVDKNMENEEEDEEEEDDEEEEEAEEEEKGANEEEEEEEPEEDEGADEEEEAKTGEAPKRRARKTSNPTEGLTVIDRNTLRLARASGADIPNARNSYNIFRHQWFKDHPGTTYQSAVDAWGQMDPNEVARFDRLAAEERVAQAAALDAALRGRSDAGVTAAGLGVTAPGRSNAGETAPLTLLAGAPAAATAWQTLGPFVLKKTGAAAGTLGSGTHGVVYGARTVVGGMRCVVKLFSANDREGAAREADILQHIHVRKSASLHIPYRPGNRPQCVNPVLGDGVGR